MPRYVIERTLPKLSSEELQDIGKKVVEVAAQMQGVTWIKSSISESEGKSYNFYHLKRPLHIFK